MKGRKRVPGWIRWIARVAQGWIVTIFVWRHNDQALTPSESVGASGRFQTGVIEAGVSLLRRLADSDPYYELARGFAHRFARSHPEYSICRSAPLAQGNTNRIVLGRRENLAIIIKVYGDEVRKSCELFALDHLATTGLVPQVIDRGTNNLLVMSRVAGKPLNQLLRSHADGGAGLLEMSRQETASSIKMATRDEQNEIDAPKFIEIGRQIGQALAKISRIPAPYLENVDSAEYKPGTLSFQQVDLGVLLRRYLDASWRIHRSEPSYQGDLFRRSLELQEDHLETILRQEQFLYLYDMNPGNMLIEGESLSGFVDLEACRCGTEAMQLGSALFNFANFPHIWRSLLAGYEQSVGYRVDRTRLEATLAMGHFHFWNFITYWGDSSSRRPTRFPLPDAAVAARHFRACEAAIAAVLSDNGGH